jgi:peptide/nickel transport system substrate-binding protein
MSVRRLTGACCLTLAALLLACGPAPQRADSQGSADTVRTGTPKRILAAIRGDPFTFADAINAAGGGRVAGVREIEQMMNAGLGVVDPQGQLRPILAETIPSVQAGTWKLMPDGRMETTWKLRPNATWQDGTPFTAADLQFTNRIATNPNLTISQDAAYEFIDAIEAPDPQTLVVTWKAPYIEADALFTRTERSNILPMPRHLLEQTYADNPLGILEHPYWTQDFIGTGAYRLKEWTSGSHMVLRANDGFVLGRPKVDEIEVKFLWDTNVVVANVLSGAVELTLGAGLSVDQAMLVREQWRDGRVETPLVTLTGLWPQFINPDPPAIADVRFRRAMLHALDRQQVVDTFMGGLTPVAHSFIPPDDPDYGVIGPNVVRYDYDPARAMRLIEEVGYTRGPDGFYRDASGRRLVVELRTTAHPLREQLQPVIGEFWQRVGAGMDPIIIPRQRAQDREYRATTLGFDFRFNPPDVTRYHSTKIPLPENNYRGDNNARYRSAELDGLLDRYLVTIPKPERLQILGQVIRHMTDQLVVVPLLHDAEPALLGNRLINVSARKADSYQPWNVHEWDVR